MYSIETILSITKGKWLQQVAPAEIEYLLPDSRTVLFPATSLFFALKGPRRDGHDFIKEAYGKSVRNFIICRGDKLWLPPDANIILVPDTLMALQQLAAYHRREYSYPVIGITGSNGKTIVKEWLNQLLEEKFSIVRSPRSYNSQTGVPLSVWQMNSHHNLGIFEAGISQPAEMGKLEKVIQPGIGILTNIGEAHSEGFSDLRQKLKEKFQLFRHVQVLVYCSDDPLIKEMVSELVNECSQSGRAVQLFDWGKNSDAAFRIGSVIKRDETSGITAMYRNEEIQVTIPFTDDASIENAITCYCTCLCLGVDGGYIKDRLKKLAPVAMRLELKKGINDCSIINDSYSADLSSLKIALDFLSRQQQHTRKTVILSDIPETGKREVELYTLVAAVLHEKGINRFIGIGPQLSGNKKLFEAVNGLEAAFYDNTDAFKADFSRLTFKSETILLKGARVFAFERLLYLLEQKIHQTVLEINLNDVLHNLRQYQQVIKPSTKIMAMVKAASYGSGTYEIASLLQFHKADYLAVAYADEGIDLRNAGISLPIMVMNPEPNSFDALVQFNLEPDIYSFEMLRLLNAYLKKEGLRQFPIHIELETGMNRLGFDISDTEVLSEVLLTGHCKVQSVFTHLAASEDAEKDDFTQQQAEKYFTAVSLLKQKIPYSFLQHMANSAAIIRHPQLQLDMVRLGIGLYGIDSTAADTLNLREVCTLKTTVAQIKTVKKGETIGYGRKGIANTDLKIATVRIGYADGYPRRLSNGKGKMLINGKEAPVIGIISMDMAMLDITRCGVVEEGDEVIVFGKGLSVVELANAAQTIPYEIMAGISQRVKRVYFEE